MRSPDKISRLQIHCDEIEPGMSDFALLDIDTRSVVGMISLRYKRSDEPTLSFAIPVESVIESFPNIEKENPGLKEFNNFLNAIGKSGSLEYDKFEDVYVVQKSIPKSSRLWKKRDVF